MNNCVAIEALHAAVDVSGQSEEEWTVLLRQLCDKSSVVAHRVALWHSHEVGKLLRAGEHVIIEELQEVVAQYSQVTFVINSSSVDRVF